VFRSGAASKVGGPVNRTKQSNRRRCYGPHFNCHTNDSDRKLSNEANLKNTGNSPLHSHFHPISVRNTFPVIAYCSVSPMFPDTFEWLERRITSNDSPSATLFTNHLHFSRTTIRPFVFHPNVRLPFHDHLD
jgi:hypothetical protein